MWEIPRPIVNQILSHALRCHPQECVGILSGQGRLIRHCHPMTNALADTRRFLADPNEQIQLFKALRTQDEQVVALYHSHPTAPAEPSMLDLQQAHYPDALYLIVSLATDGRLDMHGYTIHEGQATLQELTIYD
ncbi:Mov34/MPN/PAD-1 family protein [Magnetococcus marinus MC-1]|uniref:Mov34/MPN/PAD-1 family protein n=1 Tax=Magnetococcus marinus (strain ATCC BAA-1437 / JCM 17883 / MC-1) TaxID=156889 RepID=A0LE01_MAGMM|nr:M67 family metallopeptidase [Magnetococcus marinus]ABK46194.1 Mov34/MPN/PAD-1 family protein [Magnetococcus marinus MC-1]